MSAALNTLRASAIECSGISCDVSRREQVQLLLEHALERYGRVDVWVNNAGTPPPYGPSASVRVADFLATIDTNVVGSYYGSVTALRYFLPQHAGKLINILGRGDDGAAVPLQAGYAASKAWLRSFTRSLAREYKKSGVGVFAFNPGMMSTDFLTRLEVVEGYERRLRVMPTIIRMWSNPPEVPATRMVWLASSATDGRTGIELHQMGRLALLTGATPRDGGV